jgi:succinate dehydrogenase/fumarate reductase flavoprotein subunit
VDEHCATKVPGLYAAGDAATRELICGGFTGGGSHNAAWAMSSGYWSGEAAATFALKQGIHGSNRNARGLSEVTGIPTRETCRKDAPDSSEMLKSVQNEVFPYDLNWFRNETGLKNSLHRLHRLWHELKEGVQARDGNILRIREAAAMIATARWMYTSGIERRETRGMHRREDFPGIDQNQHYRLISGGLDHTWVKPEIKEKEEVILPKGAVV